MGLYDDQIKQRIQADDESFVRSFAELSGAVMGEAPFVELADRERAKNAIETILKYFRVPIKSLPNNITDLNDQLEYLMRPSGIMRRRVQLSEKWFRDAEGALLGRIRTTNEVIALIPDRLGRYSYFDYISGKWVRINAKNAGEISPSAYCFYRSLPLRAISMKDFLVFLVRTLSPADLVLLALMTLLATAAGMVVPYINAELFGSVLEVGRLGDITPLIAAGVTLLGVTISIFLINAVKSLLSAKIKIKTGLAAQSAVMMRLLSLPATFFKNYSSGELSSRAAQAETLCALLIDGVVATLLTSIFSLTYVVQIFQYARVLLAPAIIIIVANAVFSVVLSIAQLKISKKQMEIAAKESGITHSLIGGIQKLKLAGAERRAFSKWATLYAKRAKLQYSPPAIIVLGGVINLLISSIGMIVIYFNAVGNVGVAEYMAFNSAYGMVSGAFLSLSGAALAVARVGNIFGMMKPIFYAEPEISEGKAVVTRLSGAIEVSNLSFRYSESMPLVLDDISFKIRPGSYTAIVGATGCGKSTLMRLMLGFETPQKGAIYFDGKDLAKLDLKSLRRNNIGVVLQSGQLFQGDIFSNIVISAPWLTQEDAWEAAEIAGIADDIRAMPMGMHTKISEGSGGVSGGQRQRLMIARSVAPKPKILMLDEATSALDNITQRSVSDALSRLKCTRIVIAHRLSTIKECDRIIVLDQGKMAEDGTYEELIEKNGIFAELVKRQMVDAPKE